MQAGDKISFGGYDWQVLAIQKPDIQNHAALIITEHIIGQRAFHDKSGDISWADCELRKYLNGDFYETFSKADQANIISVINQNPDNHWYGSSGGADTRDKIFLLSMDEVVCKYFGDSSQLLYNPGKNQKYWFQRKDTNNSKRGACFEGCGWWWWLRTPGRANNKAVYVWDDGNIGIQGNGTFRYSSNTIHPLTGDNSGGVRPALWLNI